MISKLHVFKNSQFSQKLNLGKKLLSAVIVLGMSTLFFGCNKPSVELPNVYTDAENGVEIKYPADWEKEGMAGIVVLTAPAGEQEDDFRESLSFMSKPSPASKDKDLDAYVTETVGLLEQNVEGFADLKMEDTELLGIPAKDIYYSGTHENKRLKFRHVFAMEGEKSHLVTYASVTETPKEIDDAANAIIKSISSIR